MASSCTYGSCDECFVNFRLFYTILLDNYKLMDFLHGHRVVPCHIKCRKCKSCFAITTHNFTNLVFRCQKKYKKNKRLCNISVFAMSHTFFSRSHLKVTQVMEFVYLYLTRPPPRVHFICRDLGLSTATVTDWMSFIREVFDHWAFSHSQQIGGRGCIVEVDEAKIGKRKYNRGRYLEGQWVVGDIQRGTTNFFLVAVEDRTSETLTRIIKEYVKPGSTIYTDFWKAYDKLFEEHYDHLTVNHSLNFVDLDTGCAHAEYRAALD